MPPKHSKSKKKAPPSRKKVVAIVAPIPRPRVLKVSGSGDYRITPFTRVKGRGDYFKDLGSALGGGVGSIIDTGAGLFKAITGAGDYRERVAKHANVASAMSAFHANSVFNGVANNSSMTMGANNVQFGGGPPRVQHREFIGSIYGGQGVDFATQVYRIQPGLRGAKVMFPWLSFLAQNFQQYKLLGAILEYESTSSNFTTNTALGSVSMSTIYDANATPLSSEAEVLNNEFTTTSDPSKSFIHPLECASSQNPITMRYIRSNNSVASDERFDDVGVFQISVCGNSANSNNIIGKLFITYDIELYKPQLPDVHVGTSYVGDVVSVPGSTYWLGNTGEMRPNPGSSLDVKVEYDNFVRMPTGYPGAYMAIIASDASVSPFTSYPSMRAIGANISPLPLFPGSGGPSSASIYMGGWGYSGANTNYGMVGFAFTTTAQTVADNYFAFDGPNCADNANTTMFVVPLDNDIVGVVEKMRARLSSRLSDRDLKQILALASKSVPVTAPDRHQKLLRLARVDDEDSDSDFGPSSTPIVQPLVNPRIDLLRKETLVQNPDDKERSLAESILLSISRRSNVLKTSEPAPSKL